MASVLSTIGMLFYIPIVMYVPALALSQGMSSALFPKKKRQSRQFVCAFSLKEFS
jgi:hypothetical protein